MTIRSVHSLALAIVASVYGCTSQSISNNMDQPPRTDTYIGWVRFVGEFTLYDNASAFRETRREHCLSGALPLQKQTEAAERFNGKRVKVTAIAVPWSLPDPLALSLNHEGSPITNWCGGQYVLFATDIVLE